METQFLYENGNYEKKGNGSVLRLILVTNRDSNKPNMIKTAVYSDADNRLWSIPVEEFLEEYEYMNGKNQF